MAPTLESFIVVEDTLDGRRLVANPYFFMVDSQGNQLPYINEINEVYIGDEDVQTAKMVAGEVSYKAQSVNLPSGPVLLQNAEKGNYSVELRPTSRDFTELSGLGVVGTRQFHWCIALPGTRR